MNSTGPREPATRPVDDAIDDTAVGEGIDDGVESSIDGIEILTLHDADQMTDVVNVFQQIWGTVAELVTIEMLMAITHSGGYVSAAYDVSGSDRNILGASVGILARHQGASALHSHITGLLPGARRSGLGRAMKLHQRRWAAGHDIEWITWTYDPLVRRNAWFNIAVLGAEVHEYLPSFYGTMTDAINAGDESDRLLVAWRVDPGDEGAGGPQPAGRPGSDGRSLRDGSDAPDDAILVPTPEDVVALRRTDPAEVSRWRRETRAAFRRALDDGARVIGFTRDGSYVLEPAR